MTLTAEQMTMLGRPKLDFIGWQHGKDSTSILCNDRETGNATYAFAEKVLPIDILMHTVEKRKEFRKNNDE